MASAEHVDVVIVGAGLSGIGAAHHLQDRLPHKRYAILEAREAIGGTWDLFRYPGVRSDSDMFTLGYRFRPWVDSKALADGPAILEYVRETAREAGIERHIRFGHRVTRAAWSSERARWTVQTERRADLTCDFLYVCGGYYRYDAGYLPEFPGAEDFEGRIVHPQFWPEDLDYAGKRVVVVGSGATAVTLVPALTDQAEHVTMLQRSPTYILSIPAQDPIANGLRRLLGPRAAYPIARWKNVALATLVYQASQRRPRFMRALLRKGVMRSLPAGYDVDTHFNPHYGPWDQRLCLVPDGDLFKALSAGRASMVTDTIERFTPRGIRLASGAQLEADVIVTATGLNLLALGGIELAVDGEPVSLPDRLAYKGMMLSDVPNFAFTIGYTNASWTLKADLVAEYVCRLLAYMERHGYRRCVPVDDGTAERRPLIDFQAGYVQRSLHLFPQGGASAPWKLGMSYAQDVVTLRHRGLEDGALRFAS
jgi:monooxygenase